MDFYIRSILLLYLPIIHDRGIIQMYFIPLRIFNDKVPVVYSVYNKNHEYGLRVRARINTRY